MKLPPARKNGKTIPLFRMAPAGSAARACSARVLNIHNMVLKRLIFNRYHRESLLTLTALTLNSGILAMGS